VGLEGYEEHVCNEQNNAASDAKSTYSREQTERPWHEERVASGTPCAAQQKLSPGATENLLRKSQLIKPSQVFECENMQQTFEATRDREVKFTHEPRRRLGHRSHLRR
jgi:hypothetical protein